MLSKKYNVQIQNYYITYYLCCTDFETTTVKNTCSFHTLSLPLPNSLFNDFSFEIANLETLRHCLLESPEYKAQGFERGLSTFKTQMQRTFDVCIPIKKEEIM